MSLTGKVAIVTGGARGIGKAICSAFADAGVSVAINDVGDASAVVAELTGKGQRAIAAPGDVANADAMANVVERTVAQFGRLDIFVANAAFSERGPFLELSDEAFQRTINVSMWGAFYGLRAAARQMVKQGTGGSIVLVGSKHSYVPIPGAMPYNMAKAAVDQMARSAAVELLPHKIRVNIIHPGWVDTPGERKFFTDEQLMNFGASQPWGRLCQPEEIARGVLFFADDASDYVNGATLLIDGGPAVGPMHKSR